MKDKILFFAALLALWWTFAWWGASEIDRRHCESHGAEYAGTSLMLDGYCSASGVMFPAEVLRP